MLMVVMLNSPFGPIGIFHLGTSQGQRGAFHTGGRGTPIGGGPLPSICFGLVKQKASNSSGAVRGDTYRVKIYEMEGEPPVTFCGGTVILPSDLRL